MDKNLVKEALRITSISFKKYMEGELAGTESFKAKRKEYNEAMATVDKAGQASIAEGGKTRLTISVLKPEKHRTAKVGGLKEGSVFHQIAEEERDAKAERYLASRREGQTPEESGLSEKDYISLARHNSHVPLGYREENASGSLVFTAKKCKQWMVDETARINHERQAIADAFKAQGATNVLPMVEVKSKKKAS